MKIQNKDWIAGSFYYKGNPVYVQRVSTDGWFAKLENSQFQLMIITGPWRTKSEAERMLIEGSLNSLGESHYE